MGDIHGSRLRGRQPHSASPPRSFAPQPALRCGAVTTLRCGDVVSGTVPASMPLDVRYYSCLPASRLDGGEQVVDFVVDRPCSARLALSPMPLSLLAFPQGSCSERDC